MVSSGSPTGVGATLHEIWRDVLGLEVDGSTNFFEAGGDSLLLLRVVAKARTAGIKIPVPLFLRDPTLAGLTEALRSAEAPSVQASPGPAPAPWPVDVPLLPSQVRFFEWRVEDPDAYSTTLVATTDGSLDVAMLAQALRVLSQRHAALSMTFPAGADGRSGHLPPTPPTVTLDHVSGGDVDRLVATVERSLDLARGPLWSCGYADLGREGLFCIAVHQLAADGPSVDALLTDLQDVYAELQRGHQPGLGDPLAVVTHAVDLASFAVGEAAEAAAFWRQRPWSRVARLPRTSNETPGGPRSVGRFQRSMDRDQTDRFVRSWAVTGATSEDVLLAALAVAIGRVAGGDVVSIGVNHSGRTALNDGYDLGAAVGYLVLSTPFVVELPAPAPRLADLVAQFGRYRDMAMAWNALRYLTGNRDGFGGLPTPDVHVVYRGVRQDPWRAPFRAAWSRANEPAGGPIPHPATVYADVVDGELRFSWIYNRDLLGGRTVTDLATATEQCLAQWLAASP